MTRNDSLNDVYMTDVEMISVVGRVKYHMNVVH